MHPDLPVLIELQGLETSLAAVDARRQELPQRRDALHAQIATKVQDAELARQRIAENQSARRAVEKDLAVVQGRLDKFRDQLMAVKTNKEYAAIQLEIATAQEQVKGFEDRVLTLMLESDELGASLSAAEEALTAERTRVESALADLDREGTTLDADKERLGSERAARLPKLSQTTRALFERLVKQRRGVAVAEVRAGHCAACHVRLRPQVEQQMRSGEQLLQCDSCMRILYLTPTQASSNATA